MKLLCDIDNFGSIDAESDELLERCFAVHPVLQQALGGKSSIILGRKGSGKTAIYRKILSTNDYNTFSVGNTFTDYPWHYHDAQVIDSGAAQERYLHSWRYLILLSLAKILLNKDSSQPWNDESAVALGKIENFVIDTYGTKDPDLTDIFHSRRRLKLKELGIDIKVLKLIAANEELAMGSLPKVFQDVNRALQDLIIKSLNPDNKYYVCFDELDISFNPSSDEYKLRLIGLILAARDFANAARDAGCFLKVLVFLRSDIYHNSLLFEDKNKVTDTYSLEIDWDRDNLKRLMEKRFEEVLDLKEDSNAWEKVFDESNEMPGHQTKFQHIIDRTFYRPRDIIKFCNSVLDIHRASEQRQINIFSNEDVHLARPQYSTYLRDELVDEIHKYHPQYKLFFEIIREIGYQVFLYDDFNEAYSKWAPKIPDKMELDEILEILYEFSIIGFYRPGGRGFGGSEYVFKYLNQRVEFNRSATQFRVHNGLVDAFELKRYKKSN